MKKVAIYCRLSEEDKDKRYNVDSESIQNQKSMLVSYAVSNNFDIYNIYSDEDYSGIDNNRPEFNKMIEDCKNGKVDIVLCKTQSRFSRDMEIIEKYIHNKFLEWNIRFISIVDNADSSVASNKKARQINGLINEWYLEDLSENIKKTIYHKKQQGKFMGSFAPYGYIIDPNDKHKLLVDENVRNVIETIFKMYDNGYGYAKIARHLNLTNVLPPSKYKKSQGSNIAVPNVTKNTQWGSTMVARLLKDETYIGNLVHGKTRTISYKNKKKIKVPKNEWIRVENTHEAIIDKELFQRIEKRFNSRNSSVKSGEIQKFSTKVYCDCCNKVFIKNIGRSGKNTYDYLLCKTPRLGFTSCDNKYSLRLDKLEELVISELNKLIETYKNNDLSLKSLESFHIENNDNKVVNNINSINKEKSNLDKQKSKNETIIKSLYEDKVIGIITLEEFLSMKQQFADEVHNINKRIEILNIELQNLHIKKDNEINKKELLTKYDKITQLNRSMIEEFIDVIYVGKLDKKNNTREIKINWLV